MSTRDEIEQIRGIAIERQWPQVTMPIEDFMAMSRLALRALDTEADARLGKAVRQVIEDAAKDDGTTPLDVAERFSRHYSVESADPSGDVWATFDAIAAALRDEVKP